MILMCLMVWFVILFLVETLIHWENALIHCCLTNHLWLDPWSLNPNSRGISCSSILWISLDHPITCGLASCPNSCFKALFYSLHWLCLIKSWISITCAWLSYGYPLFCFLTCSYIHGHIIMLLHIKVLLWLHLHSWHSQ